MHDPRIGRFFARDPLAPKYPHNSPYAFSENRVIDAVELEGLELHIVIGAIAGGTIELGGQMFANYWDKKPLFHKIDWGDVGTATIEGGAMACGIPPVYKIAIQGAAAATRVALDVTTDGVKVAGINKKATKVLADGLEESFGLASGGLVSNSKLFNKAKNFVDNKASNLALNLIEKGKIKSTTGYDMLVESSKGLFEITALTPLSALAEIGNGNVENKLDRLNPYDHSKISRNYTIKEGDTLGEIAKKYGRTAKGIAHQNKLNDPDKIKVGQKIKI
jgi:LysM repeat protein